MKQHHIYQTTNLINAKQYIGYHYGKLNDSYLGSGVIMVLAIKKYGKKNFHKDILYVGDDAISLEDNFIQTIQPAYNIAEGGGCIGGCMKYASEEKRAQWKRKLSEARKGKKLGPPSDEARKNMSLAGRTKKISEEDWEKWKRKLSEAKKGKPRSEETKLKISMARKGKKYSPHSEETKAKMSAAHKKRHAIKRLTKEQ